MIGVVIVVLIAFFAIKQKKLKPWAIGFLTAGVILILLSFKIKDFAQGRDSAQVSHKDELILTTGFSCLIVCAIFFYKDSKKNIP
jgi:hypothetical protein